MRLRKASPVYLEAMSSDIERYLLTKQHSKPKGLALIITNTYSGGRSLKACRRDGEKMKKLFEGTFKFAVYWKEDCSDYEIKDLVKQVANCDYTAEYGKHIQYIVFVFSGHGDYGTIESNDSKAHVKIRDDIIYALKPRNMPKDREINMLFFIDACRGDSEMLALKPSPGQDPGKFLVAYSTYGAKAWTREDQDGSLWLPVVAEHLRVEVKETISNAIDHANESKAFKGKQHPVTYNGGCGAKKLHEVLPRKPPPQ